MDESKWRAAALRSSSRLTRLLELDAPGFVLANELRIITKQLEAIWKHQGYDPKTDPRVTKD